MTWTKQNEAIDWISMHFVTGFCLTILFHSDAEETESA